MQRNEAIGAVILGIVMLGIGVFVGFVGWEEVIDDVLYQVTYPGIGVIFSILGIVLMIGGVSLLSTGSPPPVGAPRLVNLGAVQSRSIPMEPTSYAQSGPVKGICRRCGANVPYDAKFCTNCGARDI